MRKPGFWGLLWMLFISEIQAAVELPEEKYTLEEGQTLNVDCPVAVGMFSNSRKAWQRLNDKGEVQTLAITERVSEGLSQVQVGKYFLKDMPSEGILLVQMTNLQAEDSGLYRCVIYQPPKDPITLFYPVRLVVAKNPSETPASDENPIQISAQISTLPPITTENWSKLHPSPRTVTQPFSVSTASVSSPGLTVTPTNVTDVTRDLGISILIPVACGLLSKSLVFIALFAVTQRSFAP
ncbi:triggering receptor expressed on myeloid cells 1 [Hippopotamus amphibius kiboko]|uniref:triggering receptor expressed on myeloid cells 1 n=1 Tax=Hippopotamus amphibius kiboko TaxID=575201 RepID=UPI0025976227|nr:triggering receptor expressed on myeloid cells 1 [Hippopotamus amphibius kiboko]